MWALAAARLLEIERAQAGARPAETVADWLQENGHPLLKVDSLPEGVEFGSFTRVYSHLKGLVDKYPAALPRDGIRVSFRDARAFGQWDEAEHRLTLPAQYYGDAARLQQLENRLMRMADAGHTPDGCTSPEYVVSHEFGHCLRHRLDGPRYA